MNGAEDRRAFTSCEKMKERKEQMDRGTKYDGGIEGQRKEEVRKESRGGPLYFGTLQSFPFLGFKQPGKKGRTDGKGGEDKNICISPSVPSILLQPFFNTMAPLTGER